ncbi:MAG: hypothetical protein ACOH10_07795 [Rhodoglobus sp.]
MTKTKRPVKARFVFEPVGFDRFDPRPNQPKAGTLVVKVQPFGCPKNGTMGFTYVEDAETGEFYGLVLLNSLTRKGKVA